MAENYHDQEFIEYVVKNLVEKPEDVVVKRTVDEMGVLLSLTVDKEDMGVVIGKEGGTAKALRTLLRVLGAKSDSRINLKIVDPEGDQPTSNVAASAPKSEDASEETPAAEEVASDATEEVAPDAVEEASEETTSNVAEDDDDDDRPMADLEI
jgi:hypothetical protein